MVVSLFIICTVKMVFFKVGRNNSERNNIKKGNIVSAHFRHMYGQYGKLMI